MPENTWITVQYLFLAALFLAGWPQTCCAQSPSKSHADTLIDYFNINAAHKDGYDFAGRVLEFPARADIARYDKKKTMIIGKYFSGRTAAYVIDENGHKNYKQGRLDPHYRDSMTFSYFKFSSISVWNDKKRKWDVVYEQEDKTERHPRTFKMDKVTLKQYYFVMLVKGDKRDKITDTAMVNQLQKGHMDNIKRLADAGKILVAGPFDDDGNWRGIFIFDCDTKEEVEALLNTDPMIKAGRLGYEIHPWWTGMNEVFK